MICDAAARVIRIAVARSAATTSSVPAASVPGKTASTSRREPTTDGTSCIADFVSNPSVGRGVAYSSTRSPGCSRSPACVSANVTGNATSARPRPVVRSRPSRRAPVIASFFVMGTASRRPTRSETRARAPSGRSRTGHVAILTSAGLIVRPAGRLRAAATTRTPPSTSDVAPRAAAALSRASSRQQPARARRGHRPSRGIRVLSERTMAPPQEAQRQLGPVSEICGQRPGLWMRAPDPSAGRARTPLM